MATDHIDGPTTLAAPFIETQPDASQGQVSDGSDSQLQSVESSADPPTTKRIVIVRPTPKSSNRRRAKQDGKEADVTSSDDSTEHADHEQHRAETPTSFADEDDQGVNIKKHRNKDRKPNLLQRVRALLMPKTGRMEKDDGMKEIDGSQYVAAREDAHIAIDSAKHEVTVLINKATDHLDDSSAAEQHTANNNVEVTNVTLNSADHDNDRSDVGDETDKVTYDESQGSHLEEDEGRMHFAASGHVTTSDHAVNVVETPIST